MSPKSKKARHSGDITTDAPMPKFAKKIKASLSARQRKPMYSKEQYRTREDMQMPPKPRSKVINYLSELFSKLFRKKK
jgi:hypothetical protein